MPPKLNFRLPQFSGNRLTMVIGLVLALVTVVSIQAYLKDNEQRLRHELLRGQEPIPVLIALQDIPPNTQVRDNMVAVETRPAYSIQPHALDDPALALGMMTLIPIFQGEQVTDAKLARVDEANALSMKTPQGKRAVTIGVDAISGVSGLIKPSDYVDIMGVFSVPGGGGGVVTLTLLQRVEVLAVGSKLSAAPDEEDNGGGIAGTITLALAPQEAQLLMFARAAQAQLQLALRTKTDTVALADLTPTTQDTLMGIILGPKALEMLRQAPPEMKAPDKTVEVFRGLKKEVVALPAETP